MNKNTLIIFESRSGATQSAALTISKRFNALGVQVGCSRVIQAPGLEGIDRVIIASPIFYGKCPGSVLDFLNRHGSLLAELEVRLVFTCLRLTLTLDPLQWELYTDPRLEEPPKPLRRMGMMEKSHSIHHYLFPLENLLQKIRPESLAFFKGNLSFSSLDFKSRLVMKFMSMIMSQASPGNHLDHECISQWAGSLVQPADLPLK